jgi:ABC-type dipeptide/oligopeptide/nickel transport system ATPase subunit
VLKDLEGIEWLKRFIAKDGTSTVEHELSNNMKSDTNQKIRFDYDATVLVISHDRSFLDDVCTDIIDFRNQELHYYPGKVFNQLVILTLHSFEYESP